MIIKETLPIRRNAFAVRISLMARKIRRLQAFFAARVLFSSYMRP
jgi:hypothetical protein